MNLTGLNRLELLRKSHPSLAPTDEVGIWSTFGANAEIKQAPDGGRTINIIATTSDMDLDKERVMPQGADTSYWRQNGLKVYTDHCYSVHDVAGVVNPSSLRMFPDESNPRGWKMSVGILNNPVGDAIVEITRATGQIGASIGFTPIESTRPSTLSIGEDDEDDMPERVITKWMWLETSFTAMPCNVSCQGALVNNPGKMLSTLEGLVRKGRVLPQAAYALGLPQTEVKKKVFIMARPE